MNDTASRPTLKQICARLGRTDILFWTLPPLMILLIVGTIAQKYIGLQASLNLYFSSFITFIGPIPFPGGATLMIILFINMLMKLVMFTKLKPHKAGTLITHISVLVLMIGGGVTALTQKDGYITIQQGASSNLVEDYHQRVLRIKDDQHKTLISINHQDIKEGSTLRIPNTKTSITIDQYCFHCKIVMRPETEAAGWHRPGSRMKLIDTKPLPDDEQNITGVEFTINGIDKDQDGKYLTFDKFPKPPTLFINNKTYTIEIGRAQRILPFTVTLNKFEEVKHPGSNMAKQYKSDVTVHDKNDTWNVLIEMNEPLRHRGYTLYQSSFDTSGDKPLTVLNVVENKGQIIPYIATILMLVGLALHLIIRRKRLNNGEPERWTK